MKSLQKKIDILFSFNTHEHVFIKFLYQDNIK
jgi:hypothetical protein